MKQNKTVNLTQENERNGKMIINSINTVDTFQSHKKKLKTRFFNVHLIDYYDLK